MFLSAHTSDALLIRKKFFRFVGRSFWVQAKLAEHQQGAAHQNDTKSRRRLLCFLSNRKILYILHTIRTEQVIAVDARNHGESPHSLEHRYVDLAEDINHFYQEHKISKAVVIGHSMGGRAMMAFALKYVRLSICYKEPCAK